MKPFKIVLLGAIVLVSCSSNQSVPTSTTTPITIPTSPTTVAAIDYDNYCATPKVARDRFITLLATVAGTQEGYDRVKDKSRSEMLDAHYALTDAYRDLRTYYRNLDVPLLDIEQQNLVDAIQDYVDALNRYLESDGRDLSVNDYIIPLSDATADFNKANTDICNR